MKKSLVLLGLFFWILTSMGQNTAVPAKMVTQGSSSVSQDYMNMSSDQLLSTKAQLLDNRNIDRHLLQALSARGHRYPAQVSITEVGNLKTFSFIDIVTTEDPAEISAFVQKVKNAQWQGMVDFSISTDNHHCQLIVINNISSEALSNIFSGLGFNGFIVNN